MKKEQQEQDVEYAFPYHYIPAFRDGFSQTVTWSWGKNYLSALEFVLKKIKEDQANIKSIVDIGCGDGRFTKELSLEFKNIHIVGIDYSDRAVSLARALNPSLSFFIKDIINDSIEQKFDAITLIEVFEHIQPKMCGNFVKALSGLLNDGGKIYLTVPHTNKPVTYKHFQHFSYESLVGYFGDNFDVEEVVFFEKITKWNRVINLFFSNKLFIIRWKKLNNFMYCVYKKRLFFANEKNCGRCFLRLKKK